MAPIAGLKTGAIELVPSVPGTFGYWYPDAEGVLANPNGQLIGADGRNYMKLTDLCNDFIVTDRLYPIGIPGGRRRPGPWRASPFRLTGD